MHGQRKIQYTHTHTHKLVTDKIETECSAPDLQAYSICFYSKVGHSHVCCFS